MGRQLELFGLLPCEARATAGDSRCLDCGLDTATGAGNYYMLLDQVWLEAHPADVGMLCLECVEKRLDRRLAPSDLADVPCNDWSEIQTRHSQRDMP